MPTVKLVVIGASGVGKTSLRSSYISGQFSGNYRATIGADFIVKAVPHPTNPADKVLLQIWDTAGQERFSSLSKAFFRGADAVLLLFDVNSRATMRALIKWWAEFREQAALADEDADEFCCVVVGNKIDVTGDEERVTKAEAATFLTERVTEAEAATFLMELVPSPERDNNAHPIAITANSHGRFSKSRSQPASHFCATAHTPSVFHTPSSSLFDVYHTAHSSPEPWSSPSPSVPRPTSTSSSSSSIATITPSLFARESTGPAVNDDHPSPPARGPKLFFTSAKTGVGVPDVFEYIAQRVVRRWEYEEHVRARCVRDRESSAEGTVRLHLEGSGAGTVCCGS